MRALDRQSGFTLFEAVVSLLLVGLVAVSTLTAVGAQSRGEAKARRIAEVESLAQDRMTAIELLNANQLQSLPDSVAHGQFPSPLNAYSWEAVSTPVMGDEYLNNVQVRIIWNGGSYTIATRIYMPPEADNSEGTI